MEKIRPSRSFSTNYVEKCRYSIYICLVPIIRYIYMKPKFTRYRDTRYICRCISTNLEINAFLFAHRELTRLGLKQVFIWTIIIQVLWLQSLPLAKLTQNRSHCKVNIRRKSTLFRQFLRNAKETGIYTFYSLKVRAATVTVYRTPWILWHKFLQMGLHELRRTREEILPLF